MIQKQAGRFGLQRKSGAAVKGCMKNIIVVDNPPPPFQQIIFILRDDSGVNSQKLLAEANKCLQEYIKRAE